MLGWVAEGATWHDAIVTAISVLIITCSCALGLAIPAVQTVVAGAMFRSGVLLNSGDAIERLAAVDRVVFDKTGTLTLPELEVTNAADMPIEMFEFAGRLALTSHHPVAAAGGARGRATDPAVGDRRRGRPRRSPRGERTGIRLGRPSFCGAVRSPSGSSRADPEASIIAFRRGETRHVFAVRQRLRGDAAESNCRPPEGRNRGRDIIRRSRAGRAPRGTIARRSGLARGRHAGRQDRAHRSSSGRAPRS